MNEPNLTRSTANPSNGEESPFDGRLIGNDIEVENAETYPDVETFEQASPAISPLEHVSSSSSIEIGSEDDDEASIVVFAPYAKLLYGDGR